MTQKKIQPSDVLGKNYYTYKLTSSNYKPQIDEKVVITCECLDVYGTPNPNKTLTLYQNGVSKGTSTTDSNGLATWNIKCDERGLQQFKVENIAINIEVDSSLPYYRSKKITKNLDLSQSYGTIIVDNREAELYEILLNDWEIIVTFNEDLSNNQFIGILTEDSDSTYLYYDSGYILSNQSNNIDFVSGFSKVKFCSINKRLGVYCYEQGEWVIEYASDDENYSSCGFFIYGNPEIEVEVTTELKIPQLYDTPITLIYDDTQLSNGVYYPPKRISEDEVWVLNVDFLQNDDIIYLYENYALLYHNSEIYLYDINSSEDIALIKEGDSIEVIFVGTKDGTQCFIEEDYWIFNEYFNLDLANLEQVTDDDGKSFNSEYSFHSYKDMGFIQKNNTEGLLRNDGTVDTTSYLSSHQNISGKEDKSNKVTSITSSSTDTQYPTAKAVYENTQSNKNVWYGTCASSGSGQTKTVTVSNWSFTTGNVLFVKFDYYNSYDGTAKLKIGDVSTDIVTVGTTKTSRYHWRSGELVGFVYDGTNFVMMEQGISSTSYYGITKLEDSVSSTSTTTSATPNAVKQAYDLANGREDPSNKVSSWSQTTNNTRYPSEKLVKDSLDALETNMYVLSSSNYNPNINTSFTITCTVTDMGGGAVANESVSLYNNGVLVSTQTTDNTGEANWTITLTDWDNHHFVINNVGLTLKAKKWLIQENDDLNDFTETGVYCCNGNVTAQTLVNSPVTVAFSLVTLNNGTYNGNGWTQLLFEFARDRIWFRTWYDDITTGWHSYQGEQEIPNGANLNDYTIGGRYFQGGNANTTNMTNLPNNNHTSFCLLVERMGGNALKQTLTFQQNDMATYIRIRKWDSTWVAWKKVTLS